MRVNQRVAEVVFQIDPFEMVMKQYHGVFSQDYEHPEQRLDDRSKLQMMMWAYQQKTDPNFKYLTDWISNTQGNAMIRAPARSNEERGEVLMWGKAQIATMIFLVREIGRLSSLYEEILEKQKGNDGFNSSVSVE